MDAAGADGFSGNNVPVIVEQALDTMHRPATANAFLILKRDIILTPDDEPRTGFRPLAVIWGENTP
jgi:hypothetical protein